MFSCTAAENNEELDTRNLVGELKTQYLVPNPTCNHVNQGLINLITEERVSLEISHDLLHTHTTG